MQENRHTGIYGLVKNDNKILVIKKSRGPYMGKYDLPGGGIEFGETLQEGLKREFREEIGVDIKITGLLDNVECFSEWLWEGVPTKTHHIGLYYGVEILSKDIKVEADGHDSNGALWLNLSDVTKENISPIVYTLLKRLNLINA